MSGKVKRARTAYIYYSQQQRPIVKKAHPEYKFGDIAKHIGAEWKKLDVGHHPEREARAVGPAQFRAVDDRRIGERAVALRFHGHLLIWPENGPYSSFYGHQHSRIRGVPVIGFAWLMGGSRIEL